MAQPSPLKWVKHLETKIEEQKRYAKPWEDRYGNKYALPFIAQEYLSVYGPRIQGQIAGLLEAPRTGSAAIGINALVSRLTVSGASSDDKEAARSVQLSWEDNDLDVMHREAHREAFIRRNAFGSVELSTNPNSERKAVCTIESSEQAAVHRMMGPPYDVDAYFKVWIDEWTEKRRGRLRIDGYDMNLIEGDEWKPDPLDSDITSRWTIEGDPVRRPGPVPVVEFAHQSRLLEAPQSEIERIYTVVDLCDLIDGLMVFAGHFGAVPIRWGSGIDVPRDPKNPTMPLMGPDGKPMLGFKPRADHFWFSSDKDAKFGQMVPATLDTYVTWAQWARSVLRMQTHVASTYYGADLKSHMSAELLKTDEAPMVRRVNDLGRDGTFNTSWRKLMTLMAQVNGFSARVRPVWSDPNTRIEAQAVDAFQKAVASGMDPRYAAQKFLGWTPDEAELAFPAGALDDPFSNLDPTTRATLKLVQPDGSTGSAAGA